MSTQAESRNISPHAEPPRLIGSSSRWISLLLGIISVIAFFSIADDGFMAIANYTTIAAITALSLNVLSGYTGQVSLGIAFFMAIGAYTAAWLGGEPPTSSRSPWGLGLPFYIWLPVAGIVAGLVGALVGPTALRIKGFYLGIVTLALIFIGHYIFINATAVTGGPQGRAFPIPGFGDFSFGEPHDVLGILALTPGQQYFLLNVLVLVLVGLFVGNVMRSRAGRAFQAVRDNEVGAAIMGVNLFEAKMGAFILSSFIAGISGALFASYNRYVVPDYWSLTLSIQFVAAIIVGGVASVWGSILGATFVFALPLLIDRFSLLPPRTSGAGLASGDLNALIYGLLIVFFLLFEPWGVIGLIRRSRLFKIQRRGQKGDDSGDAETFETSSISSNENK